MFLQSPAFVNASLAFLAAESGAPGFICRVLSGDHGPDRRRVARDGSPSGSYAPCFSASPIVGIAAISLYGEAVAAIRSIVLLDDRVTRLTEQNAIWSLWCRIFVIE